MPRSAVIYTNPDAFERLKEEVRRRFVHARILPYTFSYGQRTEAASVRVRVTELADDSLKDELACFVKDGKATLASSSDRDVRSLTYGELMADADRARTEVTLQFVSPAIVEVGTRIEPFPVLAAVFGRYAAMWNAFAEEKIDEGTPWLAHVRVADFKISCVRSPFGPGSQGWMRLEMEQGRTEGEIALFNGLVDFAFYSGTGLHTNEGLGQTRRMEQAGR